MKIHPTAIVHPRAQLAQGVEVGPYAIIGEHVRIGEGTVVGPHCVIDGDTGIGAENVFSAGGQIGMRTQDLKHNPALPGKLRIGNKNVFRELVTISASTMQSADQPGRVTSFGDGNLIMCNVHIGHDCHIGNQCIVATGTGASGHIDIEDYANVGGMVGIHQDVRIGKYSFVGALSRISMDCAPYMITGGMPTRCAGPNVVGLERRGFSPEARARIKELHRILFRSKLNTTQALAEIERSVEDSPERRCIVEFVTQSKRGIQK